MAVFRVERTKDYTVMSNHHLRNKELTLKAKGLLSQMLSLPEDWITRVKGWRLSIVKVLMPSAPPCWNWSRPGISSAPVSAMNADACVAVITSSMNVRRRSLPSLHGKNSNIG